VEWMTDSAQTLLERYRPTLVRLAARGTLRRKDVLCDDLRVYRDDRLEVYYAPAQHMNRSARVALVGLTPGYQQMALAVRRAGELLAADRGPGVALREAKRLAAFAGAMRTNLVSMLDGLGIHRELGLRSCAALFDEALGMLHCTSALAFPVFTSGANYRGTSPKPLQHPVLKRMVETVLAQELSRVGEAFIVPLGKATAQAVEHLVTCGRLDHMRVLNGFPHPSGANGHRSGQFARNRPSMRRQWQRFSRRFA
jgi:hypothetical protein